MKHVLFPYVHVMGRHEVTYKICHRPKRKKNVFEKIASKLEIPYLYLLQI